MSEILVKVGQLRRLGIPCPDYRIWEIVMEHNFQIFFPVSALDVARLGKSAVFAGLKVQIF